MNWNLYIYVSSIYPEIERASLNRRYCLARIDKIVHGNISIQPFEHFSGDLRAKGLFVYMVKGQNEDRSRFFYDSIKTLWRFLNYLTLYCNHGFMEMDNWRLVEKALDEKEIFNESNLPPIDATAIWNEYEKMDILYYMTKSFENVKNYQVSNSLVAKIETALSLYRSSFFQMTEGIRYVLQFTALESLTDNTESSMNSDLINKIIDSARKICNEEGVIEMEVNRICSRVGELKRDSIRNKIKNVLEKYNITLRGEEVDVDTLYKVRSDFVHNGIEHKYMHRYAMDMGKIVPHLIEQIIKCNLEQSDG